MLTLIKPNNFIYMMIWVRIQTISTAPFSRYLARGQCPKLVGRATSIFSRQALVFFLGLS